MTHAIAQEQPVQQRHPDIDADTVAADRTGVMDEDERPANVVRPVSAVYQQARYIRTGILSFITRDEPDFIREKMTNKFTRFELRDAIHVHVRRAFEAGTRLGCIQILPDDKATQPPTGCDLVLIGRTENGQPAAGIGNVFDDGTHQINGAQELAVITHWHMAPERGDR